MRRPQWAPNTELVHQATVFAKEQGLDGEFHHAAAGAYWERGVDLGDMAVLKEIAEGCGLDWAQLAPRLEAGQYRQQVRDEYEAAKSRGIGGTPAYLIGGELIPGDVSQADLAAAVQRAAGQG